jgi:hypothetical protein
VYFSKGAFRAPNILAWEKIWGDDQVVREKDAIKSSGLSLTSVTTATVPRRAVRQPEGARATRSIRRLWACASKRTS